MVVILFLGDTAAFLLFALLGLKTHGFPLGVAAVAETAGPFWASWVVVALLTGGYRLPAATSWKGILGRYLLAGPLALLLRAWVEGKGTPLAFAAVALSTSFLLLFVWRLLYGFWVQGRNRRQPSPS